MSAAAATTTTTAPPNSEYDKILKVGHLVRHVTLGHIGAVRFVGPIPQLDAKIKSTTTSSSRGGASNNSPVPHLWAGIEWLDGPYGKNDGRLPENGARLFQCPSNHGSFIKLGVLSILTSESSLSLPYGVAVASSLLVQRSLYAVLAERFGDGAFHDDDEDDAADSKCEGEEQLPPPVPAIAPIQPHKTDQFGRFVNVHNVECNASDSMKVVGSAGRSLSRFFPNIKILSASGVLFSSWADVLDIARQLPLLQTLNVSDNRNLDSTTFPSPSSVTQSEDGAAVSISLKSLNVSNTGLPESSLWTIFALFPNLTELFSCHNRWEELPYKPSVMDNHVSPSVKRSFLNLEHLVIAGNDFESIASLLLCIVNAQSGSNNSSSDVAGGSACRLKQLNLSENQRLRSVLSPELTAALNNNNSCSSLTPLLPCLEKICVRRTGFQTWNDLLPLIDPTTGAGLISSAGTLTDVSLMNVALLHPEKQFTLNSNNNSSQEKGDPIMTALYQLDDSTPLSERDLRRAVIAMLPSTVLKINNTHVEATNWYGERRDLRGRVELRACRKWFAQKLARLPAEVVAKCERAKQIVEEFEAEVVAEREARERLEKQGPKLMQNIVIANCKVVTLFMSANEILHELERGPSLAFSETIETAVKQAELAENRKAANANSAAAASSQPQASAAATALPEQLKIPRPDMDFTACAESKNNRREGTLAVDVRWCAADLELALAVFLNLERGGADGEGSSNNDGESSSSSTYPLPKTHDSDDAWVPLNISLTRLQRAHSELTAALKQQQQQQQEGDESAPTKPDLAAKIEQYRGWIATGKADVLREWKSLYPAGSLSLWLVDRELLSNPGAQRKGMHMKHLLRPASTLHGHRVSEGDLILAVVNQ